MTFVQSADSPAYLAVRGARTHNLRNVRVDIPLLQLVVITGPSGSGKSSLAFDTIYAEGKRQFIETLSTYARQFLEQVPRPDVDAITGLQPTLCIDQRPGSPNPRSTVATVTEIYDHLRLLMARVGIATCHRCGRSIRPFTVPEIVARLSTLPPGTRLMILAPFLRGKTSEPAEVVDSVRRGGFVRVRVNGVVTDLEQMPSLSPRGRHEVDAVVDRIVVRGDNAPRIADSIRQALQHTDGMVTACHWSLDAAGEDDEPLWHDEEFSTRAGCASCGIVFPPLEPRSFSFNSPYGACPTCDGLGTIDTFDAGLVVPDPTRPFITSGVAPWRGKPGPPADVAQQIESFLVRGGYPPDASLDQLSTQDVDALWQGRGPWTGLLQWLQQQWSTATSRAALARLERYRGPVICPECRGARIRPEAASVRLGGRSLPQMTALAIEDARDFFDGLEFPADQQPVAQPILAAIQSRLRFLHQVGLGYLTLDRSADSLSGGEFQRVRLASSVGAGLVGVCFVLDEPSIGLHPRDNERLIATMRQLQQRGNTVLVVEHDADVMRAADYLIDMGPGAGTHGGEVVARGTADELLRHPTSLTGSYLSGQRRIECPPARRPVAKSRAIHLLGVTTHNLQEVDLILPLGVFVCVTGVSGSGKSSLIHDTLAPALLRRLGQMAVAPGPYRSLRLARQVTHVAQVDQTPLGQSARSNAATYTGVFDDVRKLFANLPAAKQRGFRAGRFSFNNKDGRCGNCHGLGVQRLEMSFLPNMDVPCEECGGARYNRQTLSVRYRGKSIADVLDLPVADAVEFFANVERIRTVLDCLCQVGLGYLPLGQPANTFSGGEAQRVKLAAQLSRASDEQSLILMDEPTTGLHFDDIRRLVAVLQRLVDLGRSVLVIEHNLDVIKCADWVIDLGPDGGTAGGRIVACGTPEDVATQAGSHTGACLQAVLGR